METIPGNRADGDSRSRRFVEAVEFVHASALLRQPRGRARCIGQNLEPWEMTAAVREIVHPGPDAVAARPTGVIAAGLDALSRSLVEGGHTYLPIGLGRQGSSDPWLGLPGDWGQLSRARVVVETTLPEMHGDLSQGSHLPHKVVSSKVLRLSVRDTEDQRIGWNRLSKHGAVNATRFAGRLGPTSLLPIKIHGRGGRGVIGHG